MLRVSFGIRSTEIHSVFFGLLPISLCFFFRARAGKRGRVTARETTAQKNQKKKKEKKKNNNKSMAVKDRTGLQANSCSG